MTKMTRGEYMTSQHWRAIDGRLAKLEKHAKRQRKLQLRLTIAVERLADNLDVLLKIIAKRQETDRNE